MRITILTVQVWLLALVITRRWEEIDHDNEDSVAGALLSPSSSIESDGDPLRLGSTVKCVLISCSSFSSCNSFLVSFSTKDLDMESSA